MRKIIFSEPCKEWYSGGWVWYIRYAFVLDTKADTGLVSGNTQEEVIAAAEKVCKDFLEAEK